MEDVGYVEMRKSFGTTGSRSTIVASLLVAVVVCGCAAPFRSSGINPSGQSVFIDSPLAAPPAAAIPICPPSTTVCPPTASVCPQPQVVCPPTTTCPPFTNSTPTGSIGALEPYRPPSSAIIRQGETGLPMATGSQLAAGEPPSTGPVLGALSGGGYREYPGRMLPSDNTQVIVSPCRTIAPVGSEVVLLAGVRGQDQYLRTNERVEWTIETGSVGEFMDFGRGTWTDLALGDFTWPRKVSPTMAITSTSRRYLRLSRETPTPDDDINVLRGQAWVTVTSACEGISHVTAFAPSVYGWNQRKQTAVIHWIDVQWKLPTPAIAAAGASEPLTTVVTRHTDDAPCEGWKVRYEVVGSSSAGFAPDGASSSTVITDQCGRATAELMQTQPGSGSAQVNICIIRPAQLDGVAGRELTVGGGATSVTWTSPELTIRKTGPSSSGVGQSVIYRLDVSNPGELATDDVVVTDEIPSGLSYQGSTPPAELAGAKLRWNLGTLAPRAASTIEVRLTATRPGSVTSCAEAVSSGGLKARDCVTTTIGTPEIEVTMLNPQKGPIYVGDEVDFQVIIANRGQSAATGLTILDRFDAGLEHAAAQSPIQRDLGTLAPGQSLPPIGLKFRATRAGRLCHEVEVNSDAGDVLASGRGCVEVLSRPAQQPSGPLSSTREQVSISVSQECPTSAKVGEVVMCYITVSNNGDVPLSDVQVVEKYDANLTPTEASDGYNNLVANQMSWQLPALQPGASERLTIKYQCEAVATRACCKASVTCSQNVRDENESCIQITPNYAQPVTPAIPAGRQLKVAVNDTHDPITSGKRLTYTITVTNDSYQSDHDVVLTVTVPPQMSPRKTGNSGPANLDATVVGQEIRFNRLAEIRAGESLQYHVCVDTIQPGLAVLRVSLTSRNSPFPVTEQTDTTVQAQ